jgi:transcription elongation factor GreA
VPYFLTKQGLHELEEELKKIQSEDLPAVLNSLNIARQEGDLKENAGYQSAIKVKDELEARVSELEGILNDYDIIEEDKIDNKTVQIGNSVKILFIDMDKEMDLKIVGTSESNSLENKISNESPLAQAILGKKANSTVTYKTPLGKSKVKILSIS